MTKKELLQVFQDFSEQYGETYEQRSIFDSNFGELADVLLKKSPALDLIAAEREKQISKGYTVEHDQAYNPTGRLPVIADDMINRRITKCPDNWDYKYWVSLCNRPYKDRVRIAATWYAKELEVILHEEKQSV